MDVLDQTNLKKVNVYCMIHREIQFVILHLNVNLFVIILYKHTNYCLKEIINKAHKKKIIIKVL